MEGRELYRHYGCSSVFHYAELYLELAPHTIAEYLRSGREMARLPLLAAASARGEVSPSKIREISRVATPENEEAWLKLARSSTYRQIEKLVPLTPKGGLPPAMEASAKNASFPEPAPGAEAGDTLLPRGEAEDSSLASQSSRLEVASEEHNAGPARYRTKLVLELENDRMAIITMALEKARKETGERERGALLEHIARVFLESAERGPDNGVPSNAVSFNGAPYRITIHHIPERKVAWIEGASGPQYVTESTVQEAFCDAEILDLGEAPVMRGTSHEKEACLGGPQGRKSEECDKGGIDSTPVTGCKNCCGSKKAATGGAGEDAARKAKKDPQRHGPRLRRTIPLTLRRQVLERDGRQCCVPGCGRRAWLSLHHIDPVAHGGADMAGNLTTTCSACHRALHKGLLFVEGEAPGALLWKNRWGAPLNGGSG